jgi:hypothetical protein
VLKGNLSPKALATMPSTGGVQGMCQRFSPLPMRAMRQLFWRPLDVVTLPRVVVRRAGGLGLSYVGREAWPMGRGKSRIKGIGASGRSTCPL